MNYIRRLAYDFFSLPYHVRLEFMITLKLHDKYDSTLNPTEKTQVWFRRIIEKDLQPKLREMIDNFIPD